MNKKIRLLPVLFLTMAGCGVFPEKTPEKTTPVPAGPSLQEQAEQMRMKRIRETKELRVVIVTGKEGILTRDGGRLYGPEADSLHRLEALTGKKLVISVLSRNEAAAAIRCGRADLAAGGFTSADAEDLFLTGILPHRIRGVERVYLICPGADELKKQLEEAMP